MFKTTASLFIVATSTVLVWSGEVASSQAVTLIGNYPQSNDNNASVIDSSNWKATSFTLPAASNYILNSATLRLSAYTNTSSAPVLTIRSNNAGNPSATVLASFSTPATQGAGNFNYTFTPTSAFTFTAGSTYWLTLAGTTTTSFSWNTSVPGITPTGIATSNGYKFSGNSGSSWGNSTVFNTFSIDVAAVPEPLTILGGLTALGLGTSLKRQLGRNKKS